MQNSYHVKPELVKQMKFGRLDYNHIFLIGKVLDHVILLLYKSKFLNKIDTANLKVIGHNYDTLHNF